MSHALNTALTRKTHLRAPQTLWGRIAGYISLHRQRHQLAHLDQHILDDIGVTRKQADAESRKAPWDVPNHWQG